MPGGVVFDQGNVNIASLTAPGGYVQIIPPLGIIIALPTNAVAFIGTASWGPVNKATPSGSPTTSVSQFGQFNAALNDPFDLARDTLIAFQQAQSSASLTVWQVRITDGTDVAASKVLQDSAGTPANGVTLTARYTGIGGNSITVIVSTGSKTNTFNVQVVASFAGMQNEFYQNLPGGSAFWQALADALAQGQSNVRGPSELLVASNISTTAVAPALGSFTLTGGTDGRGVTSASFFGSDVVGNRQGIYALRNLSIVPTFMVCCGMTDTTKFALMQAFGRQEIIISMLPFALGTSTTSAISSKKTLGIDDYRVCFIKDWIYWTDPVSGRQLLVSPAPFAAARIASLSPELSPINVQVFAINGTERNGPAGNQQYDLEEIGMLNSNGILVITNEVPGGHYWGFPVGNNCSSDPIRAPIEYTRMIDYVSLSIAARVGKYAGKHQRRYDPDNTRMACKNELDEFGIFLRDDAYQIDDFFSVCNDKLNKPETISRRYLFADFYVRFLASIQFVVINVQGGMNVNTDPSVAIAGTLSQS